MKMAFEFGFFHGDPHPGNMRILPNGVVGLIDYGMVGRLEEDKREQLIDLLLAVSQGNVRGCVDQVLLIGKPFRPIDRPLLHERRSRFHRKLLRSAARTGRHRPPARGFREHPRQPRNSLPGRSDAADPRDHHAGRGRARSSTRTSTWPHTWPPSCRNSSASVTIRSAWPGGSSPTPACCWACCTICPIHVGKTLEKLSQDDLRIHLEHEHLDRLISEVDRSSNRVVIGLVMSSLIVASAVVIRTGGTAAWWIAVPTFVLSSLLGIWLIYGVFRSGRL